MLRVFLRRPQRDQLEAADLVHKRITETGWPSSQMLCKYWRMYRAQDISKAKLSAHTMHRNVLIPHYWSTPMKESNW